MTSTAQAVANHLLAAYGAGRSLALLFDYDGTLVPIVEHPQLAQLSNGTRRLLQQLAELPRIFIGALSGRTIAELKQMVNLPALYYAGTSGLELDLRGVKQLPPSMEKHVSLMAGLAQELTEVIENYRGAWLEKKPLGLTLHYRQVTPEEIAPLLSGVRKKLQYYAEAVRVLGGPMALEMTPAVGWTKGTAVRTIVNHAGADIFPLYAGDEANDADALQAAVALGGIALGVGSSAPGTAQYHLPDPAALATFLQSFHESLQGEIQTRQ